MKKSLGISLVALSLVKLAYGIDIPAPELKGFMQFDSGLSGYTEKDFGIRRFQPDIKGKLTNSLSYKFGTELASGAFELLDAYVDYKVSDTQTIRIGKMKTPVALEYLKSSSDLDFAELGLVNALQPLRDPGVMYINKNKECEYSVGIFSGAVNGANQNGDSDLSRSVAGRLLFTPINKDTEKFGIGFGGNFENRKGTTSASNLPGFKYQGLGTYTSYSSNVYANGSGSHINPQAYYFNGPAGFLTEYTIENQQITKASTNLNPQNSGWNIHAIFNLTGENASLSRPTPAQNFGEGTGLGAWQLAFRVGEVRFDDGLYPTFVGETSAQRVLNVGAALNWFWTKEVKWALDIQNIQQTYFNASGRNDTLVLVRSQVAI